MSRDIGYTRRPILLCISEIEFTNRSVAKHDLPKPVSVRWSDGDGLSHQTLTDIELLSQEGDVAVASHLSYELTTGILNQWKYLRIAPCTDQVTAHWLLSQGVMRAYRVVLLTPFIENRLAFLERIESSSV
jgi:hypothetical protein